MIYIEVNQLFIKNDEQEQKENEGTENWSSTWSVDRYVLYIENVIF